MCVFLPAFSVTQATNSSDFFDKEVFSSWHSKQASSAHDLTKTFLSFLYLLHEYLAALNIAQVNLALYSLARNFFCFCILFPRETRERSFCCFLFITPFFTCSNGMFSRRSRRFTQTKDRLVNETITTITAVLAFLAEIKFRN